MALNNGDGSFSSPVAYASSQYPFDIDAGDLDADGDMDLVAAVRGPTASSGSVAVLLNHGNGTFADQVLYPAGSFTWSVALADLDGNGSLDIAAANNSDDGVSVRLNQGDGTFGSESRFGAGVNPVAIAAADLDGDGDEDLAVANFGTSGSYGDGTLLFNDGTGAFGTPVHVAAGQSPQGLAAADFDGDGAVDLAFSTIKAATVSLLRNSGAGLFEPISIDAGIAGRHLAAYDVDGDGRVDLVIGGAGEVVMLLNAGGGSFQLATRVPASDIDSLAVADLDGDHVRDAVYGRHYSGGIGILHGLGGGSFAAPEQHPGGGSASGIIAADWDGDGLQDLAVFSASGNDLSVLLHDSQGGFVPATEYPAAGYPVALASADLDSDGDLDLVSVARSESQVHLLMNDDKGVFISGALQVGGYAHDVAAGDIDGNGYPDLVIGYMGHFPGQKPPPGPGSPTPPVIEHVSLLMNEGGVLSGPPLELPTGRDPGVVAVRDVDGDRRLDIITANAADASMTILINDGVGGFVTQTSFGGGLHVRMVMGDLNADGAIDAVLGSFVYGTSSTAFEISVMRNDGSGGFTVKASADLEETPDAVAIGDMDGDARPDVAVLDDQRVMVFRNLGDFSFAPPLIWQPGAPSTSLVIGDLNADGRTDIALASLGPSNYEGRFSILYNRGKSCGYW